MTPAAAVLAGFGLSVWILVLQYRRRLLPEQPRREERKGRRLLNAGLLLVAAGLGIRQAAGFDAGWAGLACAFSVLAGLSLVAIHVTRLHAKAFDGEGRRREE